MHQQLEALATRIEELASASSVAPDLRVDQLSHDFDAIREQLAQVERTPVTDPVVASELDTLSQRLRVLDDRLNEGVATSAEVTQAIDALRTELASGLVPPDSDRPHGGGAPASSSTRGSRHRWPHRWRRSRSVGELTRDIEERLAAAEAQPRTGGSVTGDASALDDLLERNRMTIERLGLHLGEHDRALAELMQTRSIPKTLEELAARVEEIAGGAPAGGQPAPGTRREIGSVLSEPSTGDVRALMRRVEDAEVASQADREKLMNRLERMAASIDWRLQRLEATETPRSRSEQILAPGRCDWQPTLFAVARAATGSSVNTLGLQRSGRSVALPLEPSLRQARPRYHARRQEQRFPRGSSARFVGANSVGRRRTQDSGAAHEEHEAERPAGCCIAKQLQMNTLAAAVRVESHAERTSTPCERKHHRREVVKEHGAVEWTRGKKEIASSATASLLRSRSAVAWRTQARESCIVAMARLMSVAG